MDNKPDKYEQFKVIYEITTRWHDNDIYGHVNNVIYYSFFDSAVNNYLINVAGLDIHNDKIVGFAVNSQCNYFKPIAYPQTVAVGVAVGKLGNSSVRYKLAIFDAETKVCCAAGSFTHVFVNRDTNQSTPIPAHIREALEKLLDTSHAALA